MSFLKSRIALESVDEVKADATANDSSIENKPVPKDTVTTEPTSNDDTTTKPETITTPPETGAGTGQAEDAAIAADDDADKINEEVAQAHDDGEAVEVSLKAEDDVATESYGLVSEMHTVLDVAIGLESVSEFIYASMKNGTYNPIASTFVNDQVNRQLSRINQKTGALVAMEASADKSAQAGVATQNRSTIRQFIDRMIEAIKNALNNVIKYVKARTDHIFTALGRMKTRAQAIKTHLGLKDTTMRALNSPRMASAIGVNGKVVPMLLSLQTATGYINHFCSDHAYGYFKTLISNAAINDDKSVAAMAKNLKKLTDAWKTKLNKKHIDEPGWHTSDLMPGNYVFAACLPENLDELQNLKTGFKQIAITGTIDPVLPAIEIMQARALVDQILNGIGTIEKMKKSPAITEVEQGFSQLVRDSKRMDDEKNSTGVLRSALSAVIRLVSASASAPSVTFSAGWARIASNYLDYLTSASSFGFVAVATNAVGDRLDAAGNRIAAATAGPLNRVATSTAPFRNSASATMDRVSKAATAGANSVRDGLSSAAKSASDGVSGLRSRFSKA